MYHTKIAGMNEADRIKALLQAFEATGHQDHVEEESETFKIAKHIVTKDLAILEKSEYEEILEDNIRDAAAAASDKCYAGLSNDDSLDENALEWVCFGELWEILEATV